MSAANGVKRLSIFQTASRINAALCDVIVRLKFRRLHQVEFHPTQPPNDQLGSHLLFLSRFPQNRHRVAG